ncbi:MAG: hypothetical protein ABIH78_02655 [Candidatus Peregrinibacteria bacterium]
MTYETRFLISLVLTCFLEGAGMATLTLILKDLRKNPWPRIIGITFLASALTLPYLWFILPRYIDVRFYIWYGEISVIIVEALIYFALLRLKIYNALAVSIILNLFSFFIGRIIF